MPLYTVLTQQWEPGRRTVDANLKSGTIEVLHNPRRLLSANRIGSSAPWSQQQLERIWQQHKRCPKWFRSQSIELQAYCVHICVCTHIQKYHAISININEWLMHFISLEMAQPTTSPTPLELLNRKLHTIEDKPSAWSSKCGKSVDFLKLPMHVIRIHVIHANTNYIHDYNIINHVFLCIQ